MIKKELKSLNFKSRKKRQDEDYKFLFVSRVWGLWTGHCRMIYGPGW